MLQEKSINFYKILFYSFLFIFIAKITIATTISLFITFLILGLCVWKISSISAPIALGFVFMSNHLIGLITIKYPGFLMQVFPAAILIISQLIINRKKVKSILFINIINIININKGILLILMSFILGFIEYFINTGNSFEIEKIQNLFISSQGGNPGYYPYIFLSRWLTFITLGIICIKNLNDLKIFVLSISCFSILNLVAIPYRSYVDVISNLCNGIIDFKGLQTVNINRGYLGYLLAFSSSCLFGYSIHNNKNSIRILSLIGSIIFLYALIITGAKGPIVSYLVSIIYIFIFNYRYFKVLLLSWLFQLALIQSIMKFYFLCVGGVQTILYLFLSTLNVSLIVRRDLFVSQINSSINLDTQQKVFGSGLGYSVKNAETVITNSYTDEVIKFQTGGGSHNLFIDLYWDLGIFGLSLFIVGLSIVLYRLYINTKNDIYSKLQFTLIGCSLINTFFYSLLATSPAMATLQAVLLGAFCGSNRNKK